MSIIGHGSQDQSHQLSKNHNIVKRKFNMMVKGIK